MALKIKPYKLVIVRFESAAPGIHNAGLSKDYPFALIRSKDLYDCRI